MEECMSSQGMKPRIRRPSAAMVDGTAIPAGGQLQVRVCNASTGYTVNAGQLKVDWVAFR
jgi:hypothetical protein